jgi:hypothetical protein
MQLFNGKDLSGWKPHPELSGHWRVENGAIVEARKAGYLLSDRADYSNFHLRLEAKINAVGDSGVLFRTSDELFTLPKGGQHPRYGYEANISHIARGADDGASEQIGSPAARDILKSLGRGNPQSPLTVDASESLERLSNAATDSRTP